MAAKRKRRKNPGAKRQQTTRRGRREGPDRGPDKLRRDRIEATGRDDLPDTPLGIMHGRGFLDAASYGAGLDLAALLHTVSIAFGNGGSVQGIWLAILAGGRIAGPVADLTGPAIRAARMLARLVGEIGDQRLVEEVFLICSGVWPRRHINIQKIADALDRVARYWSAEKASLTQSAAR